MIDDEFLIKFMLTIIGVISISTICVLAYRSFYFEQKYNETMKASNHTLSCLHRPVDVATQKIDQAIESATVQASDLLFNCM